MPNARLIVVSERDRVTLREWASTSRGERERRARIVLLADEGLSNREIARRLGVSRPTVITWRQRYAGAGLPGLADRPRPGRPREVDIGDVVARTIALRVHPRVSTSCARRVAREFQVSPATVVRAWRAALLRSDRNGELVFATEPALPADCARLAGIYIHGACGVVATTRWSPGSYTMRFGRAQMTSGHASDRAMFEFPAFRALLTATPHNAEAHAVTTPDVSTIRAGLSSDAAALSWHVAPSVAAWLNLVETLLYLTLRTGAGRPAASAAPRAVSKIMNAVEPVATGRGAADDWFSWVNGGVAGGESVTGPVYAGIQ